MLVKRGEGVFSKKLKGRVVLLEQNKRFIRELNDVAGFIWKLAKEPVSVDKIVRRVCQEYQVSKNRANKEVQAFIDKYLKQGLLVKA